MNADGSRMRCVTMGGRSGLMAYFKYLTFIFFPFFIVHVSSVLTIC